MHSNDVTAFYLCIFYYTVLLSPLNATEKVMLLDYDCIFPKPMSLNGIDRIDLNKHVSQTLFLPKHTHHLIPISLFSTSPKSNILIKYMHVDVHFNLDIVEQRWIIPYICSTCCFKDL